jgi:endonuclease-3
LYRLYRHLAEISLTYYPSFVVESRNRSQKLYPMSIKNQKREALCAELAKLFPNPRSELHYENPYQLCIAVMLSAQCTDKKVNQVTPRLFATYPDFIWLANAAVVEIEGIIREVNYFKSKAKHLAQTAAIVSNDFCGELPLQRAQLLLLPGIGQKTANVILGELGIEPTFPVDTHVFRVSQRLGWAKAATTNEIEEQLKRRFAPHEWRNLHHRLILHGRQTCKAQNPLCSQCSLSEWCPSAQVISNGHLRKKQSNLRPANKISTPRKSRTKSKR